jgi:hypothetical protein
MPAPANRRKGMVVDTDRIERMMFRSVHSKAIGVVLVYSSAWGRTLSAMMVNGK